MTRDELEARWKANEAELNRLAAMPLLVGEMFTKREDELLDEPNAIEFERGNDRGNGLRATWKTFGRSH